MSLRRPAGLVLACTALVAVLPALAAQQQPRTLKDLEKRSVEIRPDVPGDTNASRAMENYRRFLELQRTDPAQRAEALRRLGDLSLEGGELERLESEVARVDIGGAEAIRLYTTLLAAHPDYPRNDQVMYQLARAYETTGQPEMALEVLDQVVARYPSSREITEVQFRRGELLFSAQRYRDAEAAYAEVTRQGSGAFYQQALYKQGWALFKQSMYEESLPVFARLLDLKLLDADAPQRFRAPESLGRADRELVDDTLRVMSVTFSDLDGVAPLDGFVDRIGSPAYAPLLYGRLGDLYVEKQRYQDAAAAYRAFVARDPRNELAPALSAQAIEAYSKGGFAQLVLEGKREYVEKYNVGSMYWQGRDPADYPQVIEQTRTHLTDLAAYHHAEAQKSKKPEDFAEAARWYRVQLESFPDDPAAAQVNFRLADALFEGGRFAEAVDEYERSAYGYALGADSAAAGYAALSAYSKREEQLPAGERAQWKHRSIESGVRFAQTFPEHPDAAGVLTRAAQDLYAAKDLPRAIEVSGLLLARVPPAEEAQRRIAHSVIGQSSFDQGDFLAAESAWQQARVLATTDAAEQKALTDQIAVSVYRQAEARRASGDSQGAVEDFLRIAQVAPGTPIVETSQYDAAAALINMKDWPRAIDVLEAFRRDFPKSPQQSDITQKLAVAYMEAGRAEQAAMEFERVAGAPGQTPALRVEALTIAEEQYAKAGNTDRSVALLETLVKEFPAPAAERIENRQRLATYAAEAGNIERERHWQREIVKADAAAGSARTDRTRYLAAKASLALAAPARDHFQGLALVAPLNRSLSAKRRALEAAMNGYREAAAYNVAEVATQASFEMAELYRRLGADLMASERPRNLSADEMEQYDLLLEEQALPFEEQAIQMHETNARRAREGLYDEGVKASYAALATLMPARFGKTEVAADFVAAPVLPQVPLPLPPQQEIDPAAAGAEGAVEPEQAAPPAVVEPPVPAVPAHLADQFQRATLAARSGQAQEAEIEFRQLVSAAPGTGGASYNLGVLLHGQGRGAEAEQAFAAAVAETPRSTLPRVALGVVLRERGDFPGALDAYRSALDIDPENAVAHRNMAVLLDMYLDDPAAALPAFERYQALTGEERPVTSWIADVKQRAGRTGDATTEVPAAQAEGVQ